ncbi:uncharacterized protein AB675_3774 [Cyphellophora attinorum]|uniref:Protein kinase domain-containing protein n=1 Tax=Cyphellophora attinorum TaxID=1664694 RepID=A0A0N0NIB7_9EURO|nr:uncharacterized protein AB675_3774 [Phialophora attinorum]KPI35249.1 hypothetical protein AB675_3774 [Phialophora attinorum]
MDNTAEDVQAETQQHFRSDSRVEAWLDTLDNAQTDSPDDTRGDGLDDTPGDTQEITQDEGHIRQHCLPRAERQLGQLLSIEGCKLLSPAQWETNNIPTRTSIVGKLRPGAVGSAIHVKETNRDVVFKVIRILGVGSGLDPSTSPEVISQEVRNLRAVSSLPGFVKYRGMSLTYGKPPYPLESRPTSCSEEFHAAGGCSTHFMAIIEQDFGGETLKSLLARYKNDLEQDFGPHWLPACYRNLAAVYLGTLAVLANAENALGYTHNDPHSGNVVVEFPTPSAVTTPSTEEHSSQNAATYQRETFADTHVRVRLIDQEAATFEPSVVGEKPGTATELRTNVLHWIALLINCWKAFGKTRPEEIWETKWEEAQEFFENPAQSRAKLAQMNTQDRRDSQIWCVLVAGHILKSITATPHNRIFTSMDVLQRLIDMGITTKNEAYGLIGEVKE